MRTRDAAVKNETCVVGTAGNLNAACTCVVSCCASVSWVHVSAQHCQVQVCQDKILIWIDIVALDTIIWIQASNSVLRCGAGGWHVAQINLSATMPRRRSPHKHNQPRWAHATSCCCDHGRSFLVVQSGRLCAAAVFTWCRAVAPQEGATFAAATRCARETAAHAATGARLSLTLDEIRVESCKVVRRTLGPAVRPTLRSGPLGSALQLRVAWPRASVALQPSASLHPVSSSVRRSNLQHPDTVRAQETLLPVATMRARVPGVMFQPVSLVSSLRTLFVARAGCAACLAQRGQCLRLAVRSRGSRITNISRVACCTRWPWGLGSPS